MTNHIASKLLIISLLSGIMAGCMGKTIAPAATNQIPLPTQTQLPTSTPIPLQTITIGVESQPMSGNILQILLSDNPSLGDSLFLGFTHPGLYRIDPQTGNLVASLGESDFQGWQQNGDHWEIHLRLKPNLTWSDGKILSPEDILFSLEGIKTLTKNNIGIQQNTLNALTIESEGSDQLKLILTHDPSTEHGLNTILSFPILNRGYWKEIIDQVVTSENYASLENINQELRQNNSDRLLLEEHQNILTQQIADTSTMIAGTKVTLAYMQDYVANKGWTNKNGVKDSEVSAGYAKLIPGMTHLIVQMQDIYTAQLVQLIETKNHLIELGNLQTELSNKRVATMNELVKPYDGNQANEPLLVPYRIEGGPPNGALIAATITHKDRLPDLIIFQPGNREELNIGFSNGELDIIFPFYNDSANSNTGKQIASPVVTSLAFNPYSDNLSFPVIQSALTCLYTAPEIWADEPKPGELMLFSTVDAERLNTECNGDLPNRVAAMQTLLQENGFTWQKNADGSILPGSVTDPLGKVIPALVIQIPTSTALPLAVQQKFIQVTLVLGINVSFQLDEKKT